MGGLAKRMPWTMALFAIGAVAICALPPLNGFASEWLIYSGLFQTLGMDGNPGFPMASIAAVSLAIIGAMAVACFVKVLGTVFLGNSRGEFPHHAQDPSTSMIVPMIVMALGCICIGLFPAIATRWLDDSIIAWASLPEQTASISTMAPLGWMTQMGMALILLIGIIVLASKILLSNKVTRDFGTWDCGYAKPTARIQYTGTSFGQILVQLFAFILWPKTHRPTIADLFPKAEQFKNIVADAILDRLILPLFNTTGRCLSSLRILQQGQTHFYVLYILFIVIILLICGTIGIQS